MLTVSVGTNQNLTALVVLGQLQRGGMSGGRIDRFVFWEALHQMIIHPTAVLVVSILRCKHFIVSS